MDKTENLKIQSRLARIEELIQAVDKIDNHNVRTQARELVEALLEMQGAGLERMMEIIGPPQSCAPRDMTSRRQAGDPRDAQWHEWYHLCLCPNARRTCCSRPLDRAAELFWQPRWDDSRTVDRMGG
jgi:hypothetical protein